MKLSIITINLNNREGFRKTAESVVCQTFTDYEWIVIDGGSTDGSVDVIKSYSNKMAFWVSEPDKGIYNAMNKGIIRAGGEYCLFLNSGDVFCDSEVLSKIFFQGYDGDILYGDIKMSFPDGKRRDRHYPDSLSFEYIVCEGLCHNSALIKTYLLKESPYCEEYQIVSDRISFVRYALLNKQFTHIPLYVAEIDMGGISSTNQELLDRELKLIIDYEVPNTIEHDIELLHSYRVQMTYVTSKMMEYCFLCYKSSFYRRVTRLLLKVNMLLSILKK